MNTEYKSILDRDGKRPSTVTVDNSSETVIPIIVLVIIILFLIWMLILLIKSGFESTGINNRVSSDARQAIELPCGPGECATNLTSGFKRCPLNDEIITINPISEVCNSKFLCDNPITPFALQSDSSTNLNGVCEPNVECPCLTKSQCSEYILSAYTTSNGNPYIPLTGQRILFPQVSADSAPISFSDPGRTFCAVPLSWLPISNPGCNFVNPTQNNSMTYEDLTTCMGGISEIGCNGFKGSPCLQGILSIITDNPESLTQQNITTAQFGCTRGTPCPCGMVSIWDTQYGNNICRTLPHQ